MKNIMLLILIIGVNSHAQTWKQDLELWKNDRVEGLKKPDGWLSLIGMEWLHEGNNTIGSGKDNTIVLPKGPEQIGTFVMHAKGIDFAPALGVLIKANDIAIKGVISVKTDSSREPTIFTIDTFKFHVIERGKPALRIKDSEAPTRSSFTGIKYFPPTDEFRIKADFIAYNPPKNIEIINVLGLLDKDTSIGYVKFFIDGKAYQLDALDSGDKMFIIFADKTSGRSTYGPGRFLSVDKPIAGSSHTIIDFNRAYNPPCAFNDYSTCPLPPHQNRIQAYIEAGEKKYSH